MAEGLPMINKWVTHPIAWLKTFIEGGLTAVTVWKSEQTARPTQLVSKTKLVKKLR